MTLATQIRQALADGPLPFKKLHDRIGGDDAKLRRALSNMTYSGNQIKVGDDDDKTVTLLRSGGGERVSRKGKKPPGKKGKRGKSPRKAKRPYKRLVDKHSKTNGAGLRDLTLTNLIAAGALLRQAIEDGIEDLKDNHALRNAIANQQRAEELLTAAKP